MALLLCFVLCVTFPAKSYSQSRTYYLSADGNDNNTGQSMQQAVQTLKRINSVVLKPGDVVRLRKGDVFRGELNIKYSGTSNKQITIDAYGTGNKPMILGSKPLINWKKIATNIWSANCNDCGPQVTGLYIDKKKMPVGRFPNADAANKGYLTVRSHIGNNQFTGKEFIGINAVGGEVVLRTQAWVLDKATIVKQKGNDFTIDNNSYAPRDNWGYFIQNHLSTLDANGEWCYDKAEMKILLYSSGTNPNNQNIEVAFFSKGINIINSSYIRIKNIKIGQTLNSGILATNSSGLTIENVDVFNCGEDGIVLKGDGNKVLLKNNTVTHANNNAITISRSSNFPFLNDIDGGYNDIIIRGNKIEDIGTIAGMGKSGEGQYFAISYGNRKGNALIEKNVLNNLGYIGIAFIASNIIIRNNVISNFNTTKSDGGGIYTWNGNNDPMVFTNRQIISNIIITSKGVNEGTNNQYAGSPGIYIDDCAQNIKVTGNTVANCAGAGLVLHGARHITLSQNTCFNNQVQNSIVPGGCDNEGNIVNDNIFISKFANQAVALYMSDDDKLNKMANFTRNSYCRPMDDGNIIVLKKGNRTTNLSLLQWKQLYGNDVNSSSTPYLSGFNNIINTNPDDFIIFKFNASSNPKTIILNGKYKDVKSVYYTKSFILKPFTSVVLIKATI